MGHGPGKGAGQAGQSVPLEGQSEITGMSSGEDILTLTAPSTHDADFLVCRTYINRGASGTGTEKFVVSSAGAITTPLQASAITCSGLITAGAGVTITTGTLTVNAGTWTSAGAIGTVVGTFSGSGSFSTVTVSSATTGTLTCSAIVASTTINCSGVVTCGSGLTISTGSLSIGGKITGTTGGDISCSNVVAIGTVGASGLVTAGGGVTVSSGTLTVSSGMKGVSPAVSSGATAVNITTGMSGQFILIPECSAGSTINLPTIEAGLRYTIMAPSTAQGGAVTIRPQATGAEILWASGSHEVVTWATAAEFNCAILNLYSDGTRWHLDVGGGSSAKAGAAGAS